MAITRRQFVTRLGALAAAAGLGQAEVAKITEAFGYGNPTAWAGTLNKPTVVWVHGAECTGCSTSVLGLFENALGHPIVGDTTTTTLKALQLATANDALTDASLTLHGNNASHVDFHHAIGEPDAFITIADVLVDIIDLTYHETVMAMGGDLAAKWLNDAVGTNDTNGVNKNFVLVVEGAIQPKTGGGAWGEDSGELPWCSIGVKDDGTGELSFDAVVAGLATKTECKAVVAIGQCACFGGYPGCKSPTDPTWAGFDTTQSQTGAMGTYDFLAGSETTAAAAEKVINVPGCPTNPWWFVLTVVAWLVDYETGFNSTIPVDGALGILDKDLKIKATAVDSTRRLKIVYPYTIHGPYCPRFYDWRAGNFAEKPGDAGCLQKIGCKGPGVRSLCGVHGWNAQQPENGGTAEEGLGYLNPMGTTGLYRGSHCTRAGHPCMGCTEQGYPDSFVPFVNW